MRVIRCNKSLTVILSGGRVLQTGECTDKLFERVKTIQIQDNEFEMINLLIPEDNDEISNTRLIRFWEKQMNSRELTKEDNSVYWKSVSSLSMPLSFAEKVMDQGADFEVFGTDLQQVVIIAEIVDTVEQEVGVVVHHARVNVIAGGVGLVALAVDEVADDVTVGHEYLAGGCAFLQKSQCFHSVELQWQDAVESRLKRAFHDGGDRQVLEGIFLQIGGS